MKVFIYGLKRLGSVLAYTILWYFHPEKIILKEIGGTDIRGEILDLQNAANGLNLTTEITDKLEVADFIISKNKIFER
jgi:malate/lactate dehydrogenase